MIASDTIAVGPGIAAHVQSANEALISTMAVSCGDSPMCQPNGELQMPFDGIIGMMSLVGDVRWSLMMAFPRETAVKIAEAFAGFEIEYDSEDMSDVAGELVNVLAGEVAARFEALGTTAEMSLPTVARGQDLTVGLPDVAAVESTRFSSAHGDFWLIIGAAENG